MTKQIKLYLTSHDVAVALGCNPSSVNSWAAKGELPSFRTPGGHRRFKREDVWAFCETHGMPCALELQQKKAPPAAQAPSDDETTTPD